MSLADKDRRLIRLSTAIALGRWDEVARVRDSAPAGEPDRAWRETVLMMHLFAGVPRQVEAYEVLERHGGLGPLDADEGASAEPRSPEPGRELFQRIYADQSAGVLGRLTAFHPEFGAVIAEHAYGRILSRPGLSADRRELYALGALAALGQERQLASHARGAERCGASPRDIHAALDVIEDLVEPHRLERAKTVVHRFTSRA